MECELSSHNHHNIACEKTMFVKVISAKSMTMTLQPVGTYTASETNMHDPGVRYFSKPCCQENGRPLLLVQLKEEHLPLSVHYDRLDVNNRMAHTLQLHVGIGLCKSFNKVIADLWCYPLNQMRVSWPCTQFIKLLQDKKDACVPQRYSIKSFRKFKHA